MNDTKREKIMNEYKDCWVKCFKKLRDSLSFLNYEEKEKFLKNLKNRTDKALEEYILIREKEQKEKNIGD